jgi:hypothetical protein
VGGFVIGLLCSGVKVWDMERLKEERKQGRRIEGFIPLT